MKITQANKKLARGKTMFNRKSLGSRLFLVGSLLFLFDGFLELTEGISIHVVLHIVASVLFTIGSVVFIPTDES